MLCCAHLSDQWKHGRSLQESIGSHNDTEMRFQTAVTFHKQNDREGECSSIIDLRYIKRQQGRGRGAGVSPAVSQRSTPTSFSLRLSALALAASLQTFNTVIHRVCTSAVHMCAQISQDGKMMRYHLSLPLSH